MQPPRAKGRARPLLRPYTGTQEPGQYTSSLTVPERINAAEDQYGQRKAHSGSEKDTLSWRRMSLWPLSVDLTLDIVSEPR